MTSRRSSERGTHGAASLRILSLSVEYPNPIHRGLGLFVRARLQTIATLAELKVLAPVAVFDYSSPGRKRIPAGIPRRRIDGLAEVLHPRWMYPPFGTPVNALCLVAGVLLDAFRLHRRYGFEIIDAHFGYPDGVAAALLAAVFGRPFVVTLRGNEPMFARSWIRRRCLSWALRRAGFVIAVSKELRQLAIDLGADRERTRVIGNGVDAAMFHPRDRRQCRASHGIPENARVVLSAGSLTERKAHDRAVRAVAQLVRRGIDAYLIVVGSETREGGAGSERKLRQLVTDLDLDRRVRLTGWVPPNTLAELMCAADVFCLTSTAEGWPNVVHEALSCGTPVVTTDVGSVSDMIPSEEYGTIVPVGDQLRLQRALADALARPWDHELIAAKGGSRSWQHVAGEAVAVMQDVVRRARSSRAIPRAIAPAKLERGL